MANLDDDAAQVIALLSSAAGADITHMTPQEVRA
jgi:hypothetical protein